MREAYDVKDSRTGKIVATYTSRKRATAKADALDMEYGAVRYIVVFSGTDNFASRFGGR